MSESDPSLGDKTLVEEIEWDKITGTKEFREEKGDAGSDTDSDSEGDGDKIPGFTPRVRKNKGVYSKIKETESDGGIENLAEERKKRGRDSPGEEAGYRKRSASQSTVVNPTSTPREKKKEEKGDLEAFERSRKMFRTPPASERKEEDGEGDKRKEESNMAQILSILKSMQEKSDRRMDKLEKAIEKIGEDGEDRWRSIREEIKTAEDKRKDEEKSREERMRKDIEKIQNNIYKIETERKSEGEEEKKHFRKEIEKVKEEAKKEREEYKKECEKLWEKIREMEQREKKEEKESSESPEDKERRERSRQNERERWSEQEKINKNIRRRWELEEREKRRENMVIYGLKWEKPVEKEKLEGWLKEELKVEVEVERIWSIGKDKKDIGFRVNNRRAKEKIMTEKKRLKGSNVVIEHDLTRREREIKKMAVEETKKMKVEGHRVRVGYMKYWIDDTLWTWEEERDGFVRRTDENERRTNRELNEGQENFQGTERN